ncbi:MAG TPA: alanine dehydrogenase [Acidimicrobiia bacterium]|nr:alanine dehydrogenase [Acidimicrobiia bacterium]
MIVGVPAEIKPDEYRIAMTPAGVRELTAHGHRVMVQKDAGRGSSIDDAGYTAVGGEILPTAADVFAAADLIVKVKEPQPSEIAMLEPRHVLFTYLHLAANPDEARGLVASGAISIAYETVQLPNGTLPLLAPMSEIAGRMAAQAGAHHLERTHGGRGVLLGGVPGVPPARVTVLGAGTSGSNAAMIAAGMGANVVMLDVNVDRLRHIDELAWGRIVTVHSSRHSVGEYVASADLVIGAVLIAGARAPVLVSEEQVAAMRPGSVVVDISIDQGGCIATARETTHHDPVYTAHGVLHYCVGNIPGAVPNTATWALSNATLPYAVALAESVPAAVAAYPELLGGINVARGKMTHRAVADSLAMDYADPMEMIS